MFIQASSLTAGQIGDGLVTGAYSRDGLAGVPFAIATDLLDESVCSVLVPNSLQFVFTDNDCPKDLLVADAFKSRANICAYYRCAPPCIRKCLSNAALHVNINLSHILKFHPVFLKCCRNDNDDGKSVTAVAVFGNL